MLLYTNLGKIYLKNVWEKKKPKVEEMLINFRIVVPPGDEGNCIEERNKGCFNILFFT